MNAIAHLFYLPAVFIMWVGSLVWEALTFAWLPLLIWYLWHHYRLYNKK
jgi:hypothetical protein